MMFRAIPSDGHPIGQMTGYTSIIRQGTVCQ
jgi:hypothetical protein